MNNEIGLKIKEIAEKKNVSVKNLADSIGRTRQAIYDIYSGKVSVNVDMLNKICGVLGVPVYTLFIGESQLPQSQVELKKVINSILAQVIKKNYVEKLAIRQLMINIYTKASEGHGLVSLELKADKGEGQPVFHEVYKPLKNKLTDSELKDAANLIFKKFFTNIKEMADTADYGKILDAYIDDHFKV
ncbi:MAG: helix-turn-helix transcriptional regulator [Bacteroidota bacterium]